MEAVRRCGYRGVEPDGERLVGLIREHSPEPRLPALMEIFEQMKQFHPEEPHWYLPLIGSIRRDREWAWDRSCCATRSHAAIARAYRPTWNRRIRATSVSTNVTASCGS